ncbi:MAG: fibro-slime domain-containing protein, partial [Bacteroidales bacterium]|nr:fibro-slime domain-containing protein [Bacteroidales bacterium]
MSQGRPGRESDAGKTVIRFMPSWTNTSAIMIVDGTETIMTAVKNYCGWFEAKTEKKAAGFTIRFKQTIGNTYVGAEGNEEVATGGIPIGSEIVLDSIAALSDTLWIQSFKNDAPELFAEYPGVLGQCPIRTISVMMFDWFHGDGCDGIECTNTKPYANGAKDQYFGNTLYLISNDFGSGGCSGAYNDYQNNAKDSKGVSYMAGMVEPVLGANGVPVRKQADFPEHCLLTDYLDFWFLPLVIGQDANGKQYTNSTCRDVDLELDKEGYWYGQKNGSSPEGGFFLLDDFEYLDDAKTVPNIFFDQLNSKSGNKKHNFGFTMKFQAKFEYVPGQKFEFKGDDDVWVFINN